MSSFTASIGSFRYAGMPTPLFRNIQLSLQAGDCLLISGSSGSGKTSLCYCLANVIPSFLSHGELSGSVCVNDTIITGLPLARSAQFVGLLQQSPERQLCHLSVAEDIAFGPENLAQPQARIRGVLRDLARLLNLEHLLTRAPHTLSSGEAQRVAIAATLALDPPVLAFDQPTAHLDARSRQTFCHLVARLCREERKIVIIAESDLQRCNLEPLATQVLDLSSAGRPPAVGRLTIAAPAPSLAPGAAGPAPRPLLQFEDVSFAYARDQPTLEIDRFEITAGESVVLLGENGSGKTTLLRAIAGLCIPQSGKISLWEHDITRTSPARRSALIAYLPHHPDFLFSRNSAEAEVAAVLRRAPASCCDTRGWLEQAGLRDRATSHPLTLSHGERYRLALVMLLARSPDLLLLDEPTGSLDRTEMGLLRGLVAAFCATRRSVITVTHDPGQLLRHGILQRAFHLVDHRLSETVMGQTTFYPQRRLNEHSILSRRGDPRSHARPTAVPN